MNPLMTALGTLPAKKILEYIMRKSPDLKSKITTALASGLSAEKILGFFSKDKNFEKLKSKMEQAYPMENNANPIVQAENVRNQNLGSDMASGLQRQAGPLLANAAALGTSYALSRAIPPILQSTGMMNPAQASNQSQKILQTPSSSQPPINTAPATPAQSAPLPSTPPSTPNIPQNTQPIQPQGIPTNPVEILTKHNIKDKVDQIIKAGNDPERASAYFEKFDPKSAKAIEKETGKPLKEVIAEYIQSNPAQPQEEVKPPFVGNDPETHSGRGQESISPKIEKGTSAISPQGAGEIKEIRGDKALIEIDGKLQKVDVDDLEAEPKDIAALYDDLFNAIPKEYQSRMMNYAGYDEQANELLFRPHGGAAYVYKDIPPEFADQLKNRLHKAKTTGSNMYGMWHQGDPSYGAGMSALIKELQAHYGGKGKEYVRKYGTLFDILGIPHEEKKRKEQEKRRKRKGIS